MGGKTGNASFYRLECYEKLKKSLDYSIGNTVRIFRNILVIKTAKNRIFRVFCGNLGFAPPRWAGSQHQKIKTSPSDKAEEHKSSRRQAFGKNKREAFTRRARTARILRKQKQASEFIFLPKNIPCFVSEYHKASLE